jgi:hypothetical protein
MADNEDTCQCKYPDIQELSEYYYNTSVRCQFCMSCGASVLDVTNPTWSIVPTNLESRSTETTFNKYKYKALHYQLGQEIRLFMLKPGTADEPLEGGIVLVNLETKILYPYSAMSYTWGETQRQRDILAFSIGTRNIRYCDCRVAVTRRAIWHS